MDKKSNIKVCHLTSVHPPFDIRIFYKECISLVKFGYKVTLIAPKTTKLVKDGVNIETINLPSSRLKRMLVVTWKMYKQAKNQNAHIYHFHDPELMLCGILLRLTGKKVVFDIHENIRISLVSKDWLPKWIGKIIGSIYFIFEKVALLFYNQLILAEESYLNYYPQRKSEVVLNYPLLKNIKVNNRDFSQPIRFVYSGVVHYLRGVWVILDIIKILTDSGWNVSLDLVGEVRPNGLKIQMENFIKEFDLESKVNIVGKVDFSEVSIYLQKADIGLSLLKPIPNYKESLPTKIFEYMQHGLPVITNDFLLYKKYVEDIKTGICVNIDNIEGMTSIIEDLVKSKNQLIRMSKNGIEATLNKYNWHSQETKLNEVYNKMFGR